MMGDRSGATFQAVVRDLAQKCWAVSAENHPLPPYTEVPSQVSFQAVGCQLPLALRVQQHNMLVSQLGSTSSGRE
jgi:hypothetical protein